MTSNVSDQQGNGSNVLFSEKLKPSGAAWLLVPVFFGIGFLVLAPIAMWAGWLSAIVSALATVFVMMGMSSDITVTDTTLQVGRATIEREYVGEVTGYRGDLAFEQRGRKLHGLAYMHFRGGISPVVRIQITDERDRTPYWITSTRRPEELVEVLGGYMVYPEEAPQEEVPKWMQEAQEMEAQQRAENEG